MNVQDRYNSERYLDMTCFLALRNIERNERKERRNRMKENWIYRRGDVYLANNSLNLRPQGISCATDSSISVLIFTTSIFSGPPARHRWKRPAAIGGDFKDAAEHHVHS